MERVEIRPQRRRSAFEFRIGRRLLQYGWVRCQFDQHLLEKGRTEKILHIWVGEASWMTSYEIENSGGTARRLFQPHAVVIKDELCLVPGCLVAFSGNGEIAGGSGIAGIDEPVVRKFLRPWTKEQLLVFHRGEIRPVDPDEIHRSAAVAPGSLLGNDLRHCLRRVAELDLFDPH